MQHSAGILRQIGHLYELERGLCPQAFFNVSPAFPLTVEGGAQKIGAGTSRKGESSFSSREMSDKVEVTSGRSAGL